MAMARTDIMFDDSHSGFQLGQTFDRSTLRRVSGFHVVATISRLLTAARC